MTGEQSGSALTATSPGQLEKTATITELDPRLQRLSERRLRGDSTRRTTSTDAGEVAVIARVASFEAWQEMSEVRGGALIGAAQSEGWIATGRIPVARIEAVRNHETVLSLKAAQPLQRQLQAGMEETQARPELLPPLGAASPGKGVLVGIVDLGCDFAHRNFLGEERTSRLLGLWHQTGPSSPDSPMGYGRFLAQADLDAALQASNPYLALGYRPGEEAHGTHVMDIAAGNGQGSGVPGVAPGADLAFVDLAAHDVSWQGEGVVGQSFGDSVQLLEALKFLFEGAGDQPCVINVSLGTNGGPHDGSTLVEQGIDSLVLAQPNRAVVIAASNSYADGIHTQGRLEFGGQEDLRWQVPETDWTHNEMEIWYSGQDEMEVELLDPSGASLGRVPLGESRRWKTAQGITALFIAHRAQDPNNGANMVGIFLEAGIPAGTWTIRLHGLHIADGRFHGWIERDDASPSSFESPHDNTCTLGSISCGQASLAVASYDAHKSSRPLSWFSSSGPTRDGRQKPELSAPGHEVWAAASETEDKTTRMSGTSMAAPVVTGVIALMLAEARALGVDLPIETIREILIQSTRLDPPATSWNERYGWGRVSAAEAVRRVQQLAAQP